MMENVSSSQASLGVGDLSAPAPAAGFGLEDQSSTIPSMPTMTTASSDPVNLAGSVGEESSVFKEESSPPPAATISSPPPAAAAISQPAAGMAQPPAAAPSPDEQVLHLFSEHWIINSDIINIGIINISILIIIITTRQRVRQEVLSREGQLQKRSRSLSV